jgi:hypothetical protein
MQFMPNTRDPYQFEGFSSPNTTPVPDVVFDELLMELDNGELRVLMFISEVRTRERIRQAAWLYSAEKMILEEGFQERRIDLDPSRGVRSLTGLLDRVAEGYGLSVDVPDGWHEQAFRDVQFGGREFRPPPPPAASLWAGAPFTTAGEEPWDRGQSRFHEWYWPDWPNERHDPEHLEELSREGERYGISADQSRTDPAAHTLLTALVYGRELVQETSDLGSLPPAPGLTPPATERLARSVAERGS